MEKWFIKQKNRDLFPKTDLDLFQKAKLSILFNRDIVDIKDISDYTLIPDTLLNDANLLPDADKFFDLIDRAIENKEKIYIVGDYDCDGIMSTSIFIKTLRRVGIDVDFRIPNRIEDGYGINSDIVSEIYDSGARIIITCDNGVQAFDACNKAKELGMDILITDHHELKIEDGKDILPESIGVINPHRIDSKYHFKELCGAGVVYKLCIELLNKNNITDTILRRELIAFAAIATICDVVDLKHENRYIVKHGLLELRNTNNIGLNKLIEVSGVKKEKIDTYAIGFILGPRFNASGRLEVADAGISLLLSDDEDEANSIANHLNELNEERKSLTEEGYKKAVDIIENKKLGDDLSDLVIVEYIEDTHESVAGIIAGRIKEKYHRPTIILTDGKEGVKGSGRSIEGFNLFEAISPISDMLVKFGGHEMACGLSIEKYKIDVFRDKLNERAKLMNIDLDKKVEVDMIFPIAMADMRLLEMINSFKPFGKANPEPLFADVNLIVKGIRVFGQNRNVIKINFIDQAGGSREVVLFEPEDVFLDKLNKLGYKDINSLINQNKLVMDIVYYPKENDYRDIKTVDIVVKHYRFRG
ncbi:MAG: single-stranded-DNA-specific exonuclease RecJ [Firmicutes bacterium]|nr:single-stranded-DNA-specific exonuclease RecJ [Bacillota bacterium]